MKVGKLTNMGHGIYVKGERKYHISGNWSDLGNKYGGVYDWHGKSSSQIMKICYDTVCKMIKDNIPLGIMDQTNNGWGWGVNTEGYRESIYLKIVYNYFLYARKENRTDVWISDSCYSGNKSYCGDQGDMKASGLVLKSIKAFSIDCIDCESIEQINDIMLELINWYNPYAFTDEVYEDLYKIPDYDDGTPFGKYVNYKGIDYKLSNYSERKEFEKVCKKDGIVYYSDFGELIDKHKEYEKIWEYMLKGTILDVRNNLVHSYFYDDDDELKKVGIRTIYEIMKSEGFDVNFYERPYCNFISYHNHHIIQ